MTGMKTFVAAVETGSFTAAADRMHLSPKLVSKYVGLLEDRLGVRLLHRTTRQLSTTSAGQLYYARAAKMIEELDALEADVRSDVAGLTGTLRLTAPATFGEMYLQPVLLDFAQDHPDLSFDLYLSDRPVDLAEEGFDLAIRIGTLRESNMIARRLTQTQLWCVAHPAYLAKNGTPETVDDLRHHSCVRDSNSQSTTVWPFTVNEQSARIAVEGSFMVNSALSVRNLVLSGQGIGLCPDYVVARDVHAGHLHRLFPEAETLTLDINAVFLESRHLPARVRAFIDFVAKRFKDKRGFADWDYPHR